MSSIELPIIGPGSQPTEEDGQQLDYLSMPDEMATYRMPDIDQDLSSPLFAPAQTVLQLLLARLAVYEVKPEQSAIDLYHLDAPNLELINQILGEGEVSIVMHGAYSIRFQESVLAGVWRMQSVDANQQVISDQLEVAAIPSAIRHNTFHNAQAHLNADPQNIPDGIMNALPLISELNDNITHHQNGDEAHVINLSLLPQTEQDLAYLAQLLGHGSVTILSRGYGNCRITSSHTRNVWWVQYFNSQDSLILNTLEVTDVPVVACAAAEDIADSHERLREIIAVYQS